MSLLNTFKRVVVGISGGVDSAVAALLLKKKGFNVIGTFMKNWDEVDEFGFCSQNEDIEYAKKVCRTLDIEFHEVNFVKEYWNSVFTELVEDYESGLTPNPDILCNKFIKFDCFYQFATSELKGDAVATGHYAMNSFGTYLESYDHGSNGKLLCAKDETKDQTFFLSQIPQYALKKTMFPLGNLTKKEVKMLAQENGLNDIANRKESMGICFIGSRKFQEFISTYITPCKGVFIDIDTGKTVGEHDGKHNWTLGQRCRIGGMTDAYYIARKTSNQDIYVAKGHEHPILYSNTLVTNNPYWIDSEPSKLAAGNVLNCQFKFQHGKPLTDCLVVRIEDHLWIHLAKPLRALTPGQYAVIYKDLECLGSARILSPGPSSYTLQIDQIIGNNSQARQI